MGFLTSKADAWARINAPLNRAKTIILEEFPKIVSKFSLGLAADWQVKRHEKPSHFITLRVHRIPLAANGLIGEAMGDKDEQRSLSPRGESYESPLR